MNSVLHILGAGGQGRVAASVAMSMNRWSEIRYYDDDPSDNGTNSWPIVGPSAVLLDLKQAEVAGLNEKSDVHVAIGNAAARMELFKKLKDRGYLLPVLTHSSACIDDTVELGDGTIVLPNVVINANSKIRDACIINTGAIVEHDCVVNSGVHICPGSIIAGSVNIDSNSWIGVGAIVRDGIKIGSNAVIGAGSVVVKDVASDVTVFGNPAKTQI